MKRIEMIEFELKIEITVKNEANFIAKFIDFEGKLGKQFLSLMITFGGRDFACLQMSSHVKRKWCQNF